jgi:single-strand DNA-binding protein
MNLNKAFILGNLTRDPELRTLPSGQSVVTFSVATNRFWTDRTGQKQQDAQFHNIVVFGKTADIAKQYLLKGSLVFVEGRIQTRSWDDQDGNKKYRTEVVAEKLQLGPRNYSRPNSQSSESENEKKDKNAASSNPKSEEIDTIEYPEENIDPEDIPF